MKNKMILTQEQQDILDGKKGETLSKVMETLASTPGTAINKPKT